MAFSYCLRGSSSMVPLAIRPLRSAIVDVQNRTLGRLPPFLRFSSTPPADRSPSGVGSPTQTVAASDESLDGLPFDYVQCERGEIILERESKNEKVSIRVSKYPFRWYGDHDDGEDEEEEEADDGQRLFVDAQLSYGDHFQKCMEFDVQAIPHDHDRIVVRRTRISPDPVLGENCARHLEEFEDFFKKRGVGHQNLNFLFNFLQKREEMDEELSPIGRKVHNNKA